MPTAQEYLAKATQKAAADLETAYNRIPEDKRAWSPMADARTAIDQVAEVAMLNGTTADVIRDKAFPEGYDFGVYLQTKKDLCQDPDAVIAMLRENTEKVIAAIADTSDDDLNASVQMPWGPMTLLQIVGYPFWNMGYHEGQINYIASMLGALE